MGINNPVDFNLVTRIYAEVREREIKEVERGATAALQKSRIIPVRTGRMRSLFRVNAKRLRTKTEFEVTNASGYAQYVENRRRYPLGERNPNYHKVRETLIRFLRRRS